MRWKETEVEFAFVHGVPVMQTCLEPLEGCIADIYTKEVFFLLRPILVRARTTKVLDYEQSKLCVIYTVSKYGKSNNVWNVKVNMEKIVFKCSCLRMESFGIPCEHIIAVLVYLDICELPKTLVLDRWTKNSKAAIHMLVVTCGIHW